MTNIMIDESDYEYVQDPVLSIQSNGLVFLQQDPDVAAQLDSNNQDYGWLFKRSTPEANWEKDHAMNPDEIRQAQEQAQDMVVLKPSTKPLGHHTRVIKSQDRKISVELIPCFNRESNYDYAIRIYGDGSMDEMPGAVPFKVTTFQGFQARQDAKKFFQDTVKEYELLLGVNAQTTGLENIADNIKTLRDRLFKKNTKNKNQY